MNIEIFLNHPLINPGELALAMWPHVGRKSARDRLYNKIKGIQGRKFTEEEKERLRLVWDTLKKEIES